ncbi:TetR/AcrR family transcriptional regulator [Hydrogenophaga sp. BPS33]|uniref:TetR/AcrR family transcriptional regulator n=1 Tax=Hydrogenophaga sp. BPS33 TaxID=2651974 RepID=UPI0013205459|nr:TetR family transcriptional regulator [Hydrogenophaga sp. BPS33]QHE84801.1 TetR/AcrR family transcriptional regulator [Hydrogenophaga sp. BPS33]
MSLQTAAPNIKLRTARSRPKNSKEILLGIAAKLFREKGYKGTSIRDIASRAKIEPSAIYYHYASKEALLDAVLEHSIQGLLNEVQGALDQLPAEATSRDRIQVAMAAHLRSNIAHGDYALASRRLMGEVPPAMRRKHAATRAEYGAYWESLFQEAGRENGIREDMQLGLARMFLMGALNWASEWFDPKKKSPEDLADIFCGILFDGMGPKAPVSAAGRKRMSGL